MTKKTILITGATNGIGKAAATAIAQKGHRVIVHGRDESIARAVRREIVAATGNKDVDYLIADLFSIESTRQLAENVDRKYDRLDVLVNNAGALMKKERQETADGIEKTIALNVLAPYMLSVLLLDLLAKSPDGRIVNTASESYKEANPDYSDIELKQAYSVNRAYGNAKLFLLMNALTLNEKLKERYNGRITINSFHPGTVASKQMTEFVKGNVFMGKLMLPLVKMFTKTPEQGAESLIYLATSDDAKNYSGQYFINSKPVEPNRKFITEDAKHKIWAYCEDKTGVVFS